MDIMKYKEIGDIILVNLPREISVEETMEFSNTFEFLTAKGFCKFILDFSQTKFVSSSFLSIMVSCKRSLFSSEGNLILVNVSPQIYKVLEITELVSFFDIFSSEEEGIDYFNK
ncbi:MAG: STAS domain-containing protein [Brevinematia bacterium]